MGSGVLETELQQVPSGSRVSVFLSFVGSRKCSKMTKGKCDSSHGCYHPNTPSQGGLAREEECDSACGLLGTGWCEGEDLSKNILL